MHHYSEYIGCSELFLISDPFFQDSVLNPTTETIDFWDRFVELYPEKKETVKNAKAFLEQLEFVENDPDEALVQDSLRQHLAFIAAHEDEKVVKLNNKGWRLVVFKVAAVLLPLLLVGAAIFYNANKHIVVSTAFGKTDTIILPDQSLVILNANSSLEYSKSLKKQVRREVWLKGEAYFDVKHFNVNENDVKRGDQFIVHTEDLDIEVLGTTFNVRQRRGRTEVVLQSGSVQVLFSEKNLSPAKLVPGNIIIYNPVENQLSKSNVDAEKYTAWKENKLILHNPTVNEIINYFEDNFGKDIILQEPEMGSVKVEGPIMLNDIDDALFILSTVLSAEVKEENEKYIIRQR